MIQDSNQTKTKQKHKIGKRQKILIKVGGCMLSMEPSCDPYYLQD